MFDAEALAKLDADYFNVIVADDRDVTIQSKNTGHYWYLHCTEYPTEGLCPLKLSLYSLFMWFIISLILESSKSAKELPLGRIYRMYS